MKKKIAKIKQKLILTFGYGNRKSYEDFLKYIKEYQVNVVIDVRMTPRAWSRRWYGDKLHEFCEANDVKYISKTALGNTSGKENWIPPNPKEADIALREVAELAEQGTVLLLCAEMNSHRCHRTDVATHLHQLITNCQVEHLI